MTGGALKQVKIYCDGSRVGIIALVDEATGYQDVRARDALAKILEEYIAKELRKWVRTFPPDFYKEMFGAHKQPAAALRVAEIKAWQQRRWTAPYFWAGFVYEGDWR